MKTKNEIMRLVTFLILLLNIPITGCGKSLQNSILLSNSLGIDRPQEVVTISKAFMIEKGIMNKQKGFPIVLDQNKKSIPSQPEDTDKDGNWDQLLFVLDFKPLEKKKVYIDFDIQKPNYTPATDIHFGVGQNKEQIIEVNQYHRNGDPRAEKFKKFFQMEGPAWENDKVGFRMYFDPRNGIDIFGKTTTSLVLSEVGISGDYHTKADWGMDILKVGNSLGAGSIGIIYRDSLYKITGQQKAYFKIIKEGSIQSSFEMIYPKEIIDNQLIKVHHKISITKGQWYYKSEVTLSGLTSGMKLLTGIVNLKPNTCISSNFKKHFIMSSFGKQSELGDHLGMAIFFNKKYYHNHKTIKKSGVVSDSHYVSLKVKNDTPVQFYFLSGWETSDLRFQTKKGFEQVLQNAVLKLSNPIRVSYEKQ